MSDASLCPDLLSVEKTIIERIAIDDGGLIEWSVRRDFKGPGTLKSLRIDHSMERHQRARSGSIRCAWSSSPSGAGAVMTPCRTRPSIRPCWGIRDAGTTSAPQQSPRADSAGIEQVLQASGQYERGGEPHRGVQGRGDHRVQT